MKGQHLLGISYELAKKFEKSLVQDDEYEHIRPGFVRISFA
jgi:hypothetical protein